VKVFEEQELERERVRLWYVACTRARDLLVLPRHEDSPTGSWAKVLDLYLESLPPISPTAFKPAAPEPAASAQNQQDHETFNNQDEVIATSRPEVQWVRPSKSDEHSRGGSEQLTDLPEPIIGADSRAEAAGSSVRGSVLHKMMEEVLLGTLGDDAPKLADRARALLTQLGSVPRQDPAEGPSPIEMTETIIRTLALPLISEFRSRLKPEYAVFACEKQDDHVVRVVAGVADAVAVNDKDQLELVIDWKSDLSVSDLVHHEHRRQLLHYLDALGCSRGAIVYMTSGQVKELRRGE
jgi:ATP-dependent exoDNAse (exonuclease V) beta subunit